MTVPVAAIFEHAWWIYVLLPFACAFVGWSTKLVAVEMMFRPMEFRGWKDPWLGWQGQIPRRVAKMAGIATETVFGSILKPQDLLDQIDPDAMVRELEEPIRESIEEIVREVVDTYQRGAWDAMPDRARRALVRRVQAEAPTVVGNLMDDLREDIDRVVDLKHVVVQNLIANKALVNRLFRNTGGDAFGFIIKSGIWFGLTIGIVQSITYGLTNNHWLLPAFGVLAGGLTDFVALQLIFRPVKEKRILGIRYQGLFHRTRAQVTKDYSALIARDVLTPAVVMRGVLTAPTSDKLFALITDEVGRAIDHQTDAVRPLVNLTVGSRRYQELKERVAQVVLAKMPETTALVEQYATTAMDLETLVAERMEGLTNDEYEGLIRPAFKDDEWVIVAVGAILGGIVGEIQVILITGGI
ncbi:MAG: hypothetical protein M0P31_16060 [Solirubrobacteraceae bacterium]|nr:hypothetical protein [Solirubrobacteraceae bacterium]